MNPRNLATHVKVSRQLAIQSPMFTDLILADIAAMLVNLGRATLFPSPTMVKQVKLRSGRQPFNYAVKVSDIAPRFVVAPINAILIR